MEPESAAASSANTRHLLSRWLPVLVWSIGIWLLVPFGRRLNARLVELLGRHGLEALLIGAGTVAILRALAMLPALHRRIGLGRSLTALGCLVAYGAAMLQDTMPEEILHLLEYMPLALLLERALSARYSPWPRTLAALALSALVAFSDEGLQHITPGRVGDWWDVWNDVVGAALPLAFLRVTGLEVSYGEPIPGSTSVLPASSENGVAGPPPVNQPRA